MINANHRSRNSKFDYHLLSCETTRDLRNWSNESGSLNRTMESGSQLIIYQTETGETKLEVRLENETVWLTQKLMAELFQTTVPNINMHLKNVFEDGELDAAATIKDFLIVRLEGNREVSRSIEYYNLDAIISVGYRIKSAVATRFRQWATRHIREYIVKGFVLDDERLKNPDLPFDYFEELLKRIQDIRTSERRFYQKITDIYATSTDYDPTEDASIVFFKTVQTKCIGRSPERPPPRSSPNVPAAASRTWD